jgi:hypothetical protein
MGIQGLRHLAQELHLFTLSDITAMEARIGSLNESHFSMPGILTQIKCFWQGNDLDFICQLPLPATVRDASLSYSQLKQVKVTLKEATKLVAI